MVFKVRDPIQVLDVYYDADNTEFRVREMDETVSEFVVAQMPNWIEVCFNVYYYALYCNAKLSTQTGSSGS